MDKCDTSCVMFVWKIYMPCLCHYVIRKSEMIFGHIILATIPTLYTIFFFFFFFFSFSPSSSPSSATLSLHLQFSALLLLLLLNSATHQKEWIFTENHDFAHDVPSLRDQSRVVRRRRSPTWTNQWRREGEKEVVGGDDGGVDLSGEEEERRCEAEEEASSTPWVPDLNRSEGGKTMVEDGGCSGEDGGWWWGHGGWQES